MLFVPIIIIALTVGFLVFFMLNKSGKGVAKVQQVDNAVDPFIAAFEQKKTNFRSIEEKMFGIIERNFDQKYIQEIRNGEISTGMPSSFLQMSWGRPMEVRNVLRVSGKDELWIYKQGDQKTKTTLTEVRVVDEKVQGWKDI